MTLIERLRKYSLRSGYAWHCRKAADEIERLEAENTELKAAAKQESVVYDEESYNAGFNRRASMTHAQIMVAAQSDDYGMWFVPSTAPEAYLQAALRKLHDAVEADAAQEPITQPTHKSVPHGHCTHPRCKEILAKYLDEHARLMKYEPEGGTMVLSAAPQGDKP